MARKKKAADDGPRVPGWIVSFSDMVTLLLAFFVLLQSFARIQDPELFFVGQGSFKSAISGMGLPGWLIGREEKPQREHHTVEHPSQGPESVKLETRNIDADAEKIRQMFVDLKKQLDTKASDLTQEAIRVESTPIRFSGPECRLDEAAKEYLRRFAFDVTGTIQPESVRYYVVGLAADEPQAARQWAVSASRAKAVETYLAGLLAAEQGRRTPIVYSWGAGAGGEWCRKRGFVPERTHIVIAVVRENSDNG